MRLYQVDRDFEWTYEDHEYLVMYTYDADLGKTWITAIRDLEVEEIPALDLTTISPLLLLAAKDAVENEEIRQAEKAHERYLADGPSESYAEIQTRNRRDKDGWS